MNMERRFRAGTVTLEKRADGKSAISGYGAVFYDGSEGSEYKLASDFVERIMPGAFDKAIKERHDVRGLFNHDPNQILGRTQAGTMTLSVDGRGLQYEIDPGDTSVAKDVSEHLRRKDVTGSSFSFSISEENWIKKDLGEGRTMWIREIRSVDLYDVGPVTFPAYTGTTAGIRSNDDAQDAFKALAQRRDSDSQSQINAALAQYSARARAVEVSV